MRQHDSFSVIVLVVSPFRLSFRGEGVAETLPVARLWMIADRRGSASAASSLPSTAWLVRPHPYPLRTARNTLGDALLLRTVLLSAVVLVSLPFRS